jgi:hypothetical protein
MDKTQVPATAAATGSAPDDPNILIHEEVVEKVDGEDLPAGDDHGDSSNGNEALSDESDSEIDQTKLVGKP